jgi:hypothetical protein
MLFICTEAEAFRLLYPSARQLDTFLRVSSWRAEGIRTSELSVGEREFIEKNCARLPKAHDYSTTEIAIVLEVISRLTIPGNPTHR